MVINESLQYAVVGKFSMGGQIFQIREDPQMGSFVQSVEETSTAIAWIFFPALPPNFFGEDALFSLVSAIGKPL